MKRLNKTRSPLLRSVLVIGFIVLILTMPATAQLDRVRSFIFDNAQLTGQASLYGELYNVDGINRRRPPSTGRFLFTPTLSLSRYASISADVMLSTEGSYARQDMNIMGLHPSWRWGKAHLGDYTDSFSLYTYNGIRIKGAEIDLFPKKLRFTVGGGQTKRAVDGNVVVQSYAQHMMAGRLGYGKEQGSYFDLIFVKVKDDLGSLTKRDSIEYNYVIVDTLETELDTLWVEPPYNPYTVTPQENVIAGIATRLGLFEDKVNLLIEASGSGYTKNLNNAPVSPDSVDMPDIFRGVVDRIYSPRRSSNVDFAVNSRLQFSVQKWRSELIYRYIGPGYISLATPSTINDRQELGMSTSGRIGNHRLRFNWSRYSDNLLDQKEETNVRNQIRTSWAMNTEKWRSSVNMSYLLMGNDAAVDSLEWDFDNIVFSTHQAYLFDQTSVFRQAGLQYTYQTSDKNMPQNRIQSHYHTVNLTGQIRLRQTLNLNLSTGLSFRDTGTQGSYTTQVYSLRLTHSAFKNRLSTSLFSASSMIRDTRTFRTGLTSSYRLTRQNSLVLNLSYNDFRGSRRFHELRSSLTLSHRL